MGKEKSKHEAKENKAHGPCTWCLKFEGERMKRLKPLIWWWIIDDASKFAMLSDKIIESKQATELNDEEESIFAEKSVQKLNG